MTVYRNDDGLTRAYGRSEGGPALTGGFGVHGEDRVVEALIDFSELAAFGTNRLISQIPGVVIPAGALIVEATVDVSTAFTSGGAATLSLGLTQEDGSIIDVDGIDATIALSALNAVGKTVACDGALVNGVALTAKASLSALVGTANYTAGTARLVVKYRLV